MNPSGQAATLKKYSRKLKSLNTDCVSTVSKLGLQARNTTVKKNQLRSLTW